MEKNVYESPQCTTLKVELRSCVLGGSNGNENYGVNDFNDPFGENEG